jgi:hypothetical protein
LFDFTGGHKANKLFLSYKWNDPTRASVKPIF